MIYCTRLWLFIWSTHNADDIPVRSGCGGRRGARRMLRAIPFADSTAASVPRIARTSRSVLTDALIFQSAPRKCLSDCICTCRCRISYSRFDMKCFNCFWDTIQSSHSTVDLILIIILAYDNWVTFGGAGIIDKQNGKIWNLEVSLDACLELLSDNVRSAHINIL